MRLGEIGDAWKECSTALFQFQLGAIGRNTPDLSLTYAEGFNSSLVRLGANAEATYAEQMEFQFQLGAIGRYGLNLFFSYIALVSIPAWCDWEPGNAMGGIPAVGCFNSSLVRLGGIKFPCIPSLIHPFQFQLGAIGSGLDGCKGVLTASFNSSLVRLGASTKETKGVEFKSFNSSLVRLGVIYQDISRH